MIPSNEGQFETLRQIQRTVAQQVVLEDAASEVTTIGGVAQSFEEDFVFSSAVVVNSLMTVIDEAQSISKISMPYVPGLLFFREGPAAIATVNNLHTPPDVLIVHGCGINHPRFAGLASHVGVLLDMPTVGVSTKSLCGDYDEPTQEGQHTTLTFKNKLLGFALKSVAGSKPVFVSPGNHVSAQGALRIVQRCALNYRLPEPLRLARIKARRLRAELHELHAS